MNHEPHKSGFGASLLTTHYNRRPKHWITEHHEKWSKLKYLHRHTSISSYDFMKSAASLECQRSENKQSTHTLSSCQYQCSVWDDRPGSDAGCPWWWCSSRWMDRWRRLYASCCAYRRANRLLTLFILCGGSNIPFRVLTHLPFLKIPYFSRLKFLDFPVDFSDYIYSQPSENLHLPIVALQSTLPRRKLEDVPL